MSHRIRVLIVIGTRPEVIKMAPLYLLLKKATDRFDVRLCVTAQHREMLDQALEAFEITPDIDLNLMKSNQDLFDITSGVLIGLRDVINTSNPDIVLVHGDTTTTLSASIAAFYSRVLVGHVEAGLRTNNLEAPFPEEFNRQIVSRIAAIHFAPTEGAKMNLMSEGISEDKIFVTGNTVIDALLLILSGIDSSPIRTQAVRDILSSSLGGEWEKSKFVLITGHRRENFGEGIFNICSAIRKLAGKYKDINFIYPVHLNPRIKDTVNDMLSRIQNVHLIEPLNYEPFAYLLRASYLVLTDSGGIQEEAPSLGKPVLVMRGETERPEGVFAGTLKLVGISIDSIVSNVSLLLDNPDEYRHMAQAKNPYGDGCASNNIASQIELLKL